MQDFMIKQLKYIITVEIYYNIFGKENVFVLPLEFIKLNFKKAFEDLSKFLGINSIPYNYKIVNKGIGSMNGKLLMFASKLGLHDDFLKKLKIFYKLLKPYLSNKKNVDILCNEEKEIIKAFYAISNKNLQSLLTRYNFEKLGYYI